MATLKQRLHKKSDSGTYDIVHLETSSDIVDFDGQTVHDALTSALTIANAVNQEIPGLKSSVSEGKRQVASAITDRCFYCIHFSINIINFSTKRSIICWAHMYYCSI